MRYNTQQKRMALPEYGRSVQNMVDYALTIEDREERQKCANAIVEIMGNRFPQLRDIQEHNHKLWDHLAIMSDFKLDIDYPYDLSDVTAIYQKPEPLLYSNNELRYKHYGRTLELLINKAIETEEGEVKDNLVALICNHMKKCYVIWNRDLLDISIIADDLEDLSGGKLKMTDKIVELMSDRYNVFHKNKTNTNKNQNKKSKGKKS